jgi:hypothetical protein
LEAQWSAGDVHDVDALEKLLNLADRLDLNAREVGDT